MSLTIVDRTGTLSAEGHRQCERRMQFALSRFDSRIRSAEVVISDENGPKRGSDDKLCVVTVQLHRSPQIVVKTKDDSLRRCIARSAEKTGRAVARAISRARTNSLRTQSQPSPLFASG